MAKAKAKRASRTAQGPAGTYIVLFGIDEGGRPHAAKFENEDQQILARLAQARGLRSAVAQGSKHSALLNRLRAGRLYATGAGSVPIVSKAVYEVLNAAVGGEHGQISPTLPRSHQDIAPGHLVIAQSSLENGWYEAVVLSREDDTLRLKWRDFPADPEFLRSMSSIALLDTDAHSNASAALLDAEHADDN